jgi:allantoinase
VQHTLPLLLTEGFFKGRLDLSALARQLSAQVATRFRLPPDKGRIEIGAEADLALVNLDEEYSVRRDELLDRHRLSPYVGRRLRGQVVRTLLRGQTIFYNGKIVSKPMGRLIKPLRT